MGSVRLVPFRFREHEPLLPELADRLAFLLAAPVIVSPGRFDPEIAYDAGRGQYGSTLLLAELLAEIGDGSDRVLGVTGVDLFIPVLTYVFGEAQLGGRAAVVSAHRLDPRAYGLPEDRSLLLERLTKEGAHELGHTFGLLHCESQDCAMRSSTYVEEIDLKRARYCDRCRASVRLGRDHASEGSH